MSFSLTHTNARTPSECHRSGFSCGSLLFIKCLQSVMGSIDVNRRTHNKAIETRGMCVACKMSFGHVAGLLFECCSVQCLQCLKSKCHNGRTTEPFCSIWRWRISALELPIWFYYLLQLLLSYPGYIIMSNKRNYLIMDQEIRWYF